ncbi:hypothetical protein ECE15_04465, partial [Acinetobacter baumannii]
IETELSAEILEGLKLTAAYTYTIDAEISKDAKGQKEMTFTLSKSRATMAVVNELQQSLIDLGYQIELDVLDHNNYFLKIKF